MLKEQRRGKGALIEIQTEYAQKQEIYLYAKGVTDTHTGSHKYPTRWSRMQSISHQTPPACQEDICIHRPNATPQNNTPTYCCKHAHCLPNRKTLFSPSHTQTHTHIDVIAIIFFYFPPQQVQDAEKNTRLSALPILHLIYLICSSTFSKFVNTG